MPSPVRMVLAALLGVTAFLLQPSALGAQSPPACSGGSQACVGNTGYVGKGACVGIQACFFNSGDISRNACHGDLACYENAGNVGEGACHEDSACLNNQGTVRKGACIGVLACEGNTGTIGEAACIGDEACRGNSGNLAKASCQGPGACRDRQGPVAEGSCIGDEACAGSGPGAIGKFACLGPRACLNNPGPIGRGECVGPADSLTGVGVCEVATVPVITGCTPSVIPKDEEDVELEVTGRNFTESHVMRWNGSNRPTTFVDGGRVRGRLLPGDTAIPGEARVTVAREQGDDVSNEFAVIVVEP